MTGFSDTLSEERQDSGAHKVFKGDMLSTTDRTHWYDGAFYARFVDAGAGRGLVRHMDRLVDEGASVVDLACGTGALILALSEKCPKAAGIDLSSRMIGHARSAAARLGNARVKFIHGSAADAADLLGERFDYAVMTYFLHELDHDMRCRVLEEAVKITDRVIIADFISPQPKGLNAFFTRIVERAAGREHYRNSRDWLVRGGMDGYLQRSGFEIRREIVPGPGTIKLVLAEQSLPAHGTD